MERVTILPIDISPIKGGKASTPALSTSLERKRDDFSQVFADRVQRKRNENSAQSGKEANHSGKKSTQVNTLTKQDKKQPVNKVADNQQENTMKATPAKNKNVQTESVEKNDDNETALKQSKSADEISEQSALQNVPSQDKDADVKNDVESETVKIDQDLLTIGDLESSEQLITLLQNSDKILTTTTVGEETFDTYNSEELTDKILNKSPDVANQIIQTISTKETKDEKLVDDSIKILNQQSFLKTIKLNDTEITDKKNSENDEFSEKTANSLDQKSQSLIDMMNTANALRNDEFDGDISDESQNKTINTVTTTANLKAAASLAELSENNEKFSKSEALSIEKLSDDLLSGKQLTQEQLAQIAMLKNTLKSKNKGETPPIVINDPVSELSNGDKLSDNVSKNLSTVFSELADQKNNNVNAEKSTDKSADISITQLIDTGKVTLSADAKKAVAEQLVLQPSDDLTQIDESTGYSEGELRDMQTLHAASAKVTETNLQNQKIELNNKIDTISLHRKDFTTALQDKVMIMVQQKIQQVDIRLDPPELGHMQVRLNLHNDQANVQFVVQNQQAKEALDQNLNKLKEMLSQQGVNVGDANVGQRNSQASADNQQGQFSQQGGDFFGEENFDEKFFEENSQTFSTNLTKGSAVGVDYYA